ncbi:MAG: alanine racemase [Alphaproteobacteria bacterium CG11_big_fil_rev_8_21_14_0_20_44_7]|nr:MAG: alanine racemase [Alphaproteobacteria bacterium CG11_big_fil_rev_8_21_14_0_20_44_7]
MNKLYISLENIKHNYKLLKQRLSASECAAVVKANAYGLGVDKVARALATAGCKKFFVATAEEAFELRSILPIEEIFVFHGVQNGEAQDFVDKKIIPVLNNPNQLSRWEAKNPAAVHIDTGMTRLGFEIEDIDLLKGYNITLLMSHLACAESRQNPMNYNQLLEFDAAAKHLPYVHRSIANSYGIFLGKEFHYNLARPGIALYGGNPTPLQPNPMKQVIHISSQIIQIYEIKKPKTVGYGGLYKASAGSTIATIPLGYADGLPRNLSNRGKVYIENYQVPIVGRISMDLITIDISKLPINHQKIGQEVQIVGDKYTISDMAKDAGTVEYEILTRLGQRYKRIYV